MGTGRSLLRRLPVAQVQTNTSQEQSPSQTRPVSITRIRAGGRLQFADLLEQTKHQLILPHGHPEVANGTRPTQGHVTCGPRKHIVNLKTENLADPRETRSQTCYQKMRSLPKTASWTLHAENGPIAGRESFMFTSFCACWN